MRPGRSSTGRDASTVMARRGLLAAPLGVPARRRVDAAGTRFLRGLREAAVLGVWMRVGRQRAARSGRGRREQPAHLVDLLVHDPEAVLLIHNQDGTIGERNTYKKDPFPPRG
jgi:hypothetical protein